MHTTSIARPEAANHPTSKPFLCVPCITSSVTERRSGVARSQFTVGWNHLKRGMAQNVSFSDRRSMSWHLNGLVYEMAKGGYNPHSEIDRLQKICERLANRIDILEKNEAGLRTEVKRIEIEYFLKKQQKHRGNDAGQTKR
jgi:hypothetical protein